MRKPFVGTAVVKYSRYDDGREFFAVVEHPGWVAEVRVGGRMVPTASAPPRYERWRILARNEQEARNTLRYHFYASRWRLLRKAS